MMNTTRSAKVVQEFLNGPQRKRVTRTMTASFDASPAEVGVLLCPTREFDWLPPWECDLIYTESGYAESNFVFRTANDIIGHATWICTRFEPNEASEYVGVGTDYVIRLRMRLRRTREGQTECTWEEMTTALTDAGDAFVERMSQEDVDPFQGIPELIATYLETGEMAPRG